MELVLARHAQPEWDRDRTAQVDPGLTERGHEQAERLATRLGHERFDRVLVSTSRRAQQTAAPVRDRLAVDTRDLAWMHEIHLPAWQGVPSEEVGRILRGSRERTREAWWDGLEGGESFRDFHTRVARGLESELASHGIERGPDGLWQLTEHEASTLRLLLIAHAGTNSVVLGTLLGLDPEPWEWERFASEHASLTVLTTAAIAGHHIFSLRRFSDVAHLPTELVTG